MSEELDLKPPAAPSPEDTQEAAMKVLKAIAAGTAEPPTNLSEAKAMVTAALEGKATGVPSGGAPAAPTPPLAPSVASTTRTAPVPPIVPGEPPGMERFKRVMGRLAKIEIENYRVFRGRFELYLGNGCNLLVYGENGAGKSSLYHALQDFFENPERFIKLEDNRHSYNTTPAAITLSFISPSPEDGRKIIIKPYEWSAAKNDSRAPEIRSADKAKGFLDYKSLLRVHLLPVGEQEINLFDIFINPLLAHYKNPVSSSGFTFIQEWRRISSAFQPRVWMPGNLDNWIKEFNAGFERVVKDTVADASKLLDELDSELAIEIEFHGASYQWRPKNLTPPKILATPSFRKLQRRDYSKFLNEARLTSLAIALYLAGLKISPATGYRLLVLDDILIGLDMTNRVKMLDLVHEHFSDWQILLFTYSKAWFEQLKDRVKEKVAFPDWSAHWESVVLWEEWRDEENSPRIVAEGSGDLLEMAERHLKRKDYTAAAVYARKALESLCHRTCAKASLFVLHIEFPKQRKVEHFLIALTSRLKEIVDDERRTRALRLLTRLDHARTFVLNRNAHFDVEEEDILSAEVDTAIDVVSDLRTFFNEQAWDRKNFHSGRKLTPLEQMNAQLATARALVTKGAIGSCQAAMKLAHHFFWQVFGSKLGVLLPPGVEPKASAVWKASEEQGKLQTASQTRLEAVKGYLFGSVKGNEFDAEKFEQAANLLEYLVNDHRELSLIS